MTTTAPKLVSPASGESRTPAEPLAAPEFAALMRAAGLASHDTNSADIAVAVSGGPDSMALALLVGGWAGANGGAHFLIFDHGLRPESGGEAHQAGEWLRARGLTHHILEWPAGEARPKNGIQAAARQARYRALEGWCAAQGIGILLLAHHLEDQAETLLMRLARGSGVDGLSAMSLSAPPVTRRRTPRLVRPLLTISKERLVATLLAEGQQWIEDPGNEDRSYLRVQARQLLREAPLDGLTPQRLAATARRMARVRALLDHETAALLEASVRLEEAGYARLDPAPLVEAGEPREEVALRVLSRLAATIGGRAYPPRLEAVERLLADLKRGAFSGATMAGCLFSPIGNAKGMLLVAREAGTTEDAGDIEPGGTFHWDGRFEITLAGEARSGGVIAKLGEAGWKALAALAPEARKTGIPHAARLALPALWVEGVVRAVPHLDYFASGYNGLAAHFQPLRPLAPERSDGGD